VAGVEGDTGGGPDDGSDDVSAADAPTHIPPPPVTADPLDPHAPPARGHMSGGEEGMAVLGGVLSSLEAGAGSGGMGGALGLGGGVGPTVEMMAALGLRAPTFRGGGGELDDID